MKMKPLILLFLFFIPFQGAFADAPIRVTNAWVAEAPPMAKSLAGYLEIHNDSDKSVMLHSITSNMFDRAMIHKTEIKNGMATMSHVAKVIINPHSKLRFEPGGYHLMLINPQKALKAGDKVEMNMQFTDATKVEFSATVKKMRHKEDHSNDEIHHDMKMDGHDMLEEREDMKHDNMPHNH